MAALARATGDLALAEDALQDAFETAIERWPRDGVPPNPGGWIVTTARNRAVDRIRRDRTLAHKTELLAGLSSSIPDEADDMSLVPDERLALIFACCHPALSLEAQVALTLRSVGGLSTAEIARAFLMPEPTMAQRLVRAKSKIRTAGIPIRVPADHRLPDRVRAVLGVLYLVFNEGYASGGERLVRTDLCEEAIRLARLLAVLMPDEPEALGLVALMLLHDARRDARTDADGELVLLADQDRALWHRGRIEEGVRVLGRARSLARRPRAYQLQAEIAAVHSTAEPDWTRVAALYVELAALAPSPVVELNRAVAVAMAEGPERGLEIVDGIAGLEGYRLLHATRADLLRRAGRPADAELAYGRALELTRNPAERRFLEQRREDVRTRTA